MEYTATHCKWNTANILPELTVLIKMWQKQKPQWL